ncbi:hypothetical protein BU110_00630 [Staphylococcus shinii]|uniref:DUF1514 family protein n=1 Tax=Staphylococcus shinii TaxID=2912228 RepID=UPI000D1FD464|nr:DUF1514 family protein [Staphylococcus shinii]PTI68092.1 hypothetical protein BU110_00630 [Staphylococcus shinii]
MWMYIAIVSGVLLLISLLANHYTRIEIEKVMYANAFLYSKVANEIKNEREAKLLDHNIEVIQHKFNRYK